ncbi:hypothetical protein PMAYCL1PPCAC_12888 [Pristionchus mayeri]|uniref:Uncharacterized protein n=1 Tax=Pristionchus mayeri TaxID=1317129 RepID=A0AAN5C9C6_9BILA|nr:hypothetical protein PMAYCL1PPCAC_12888 [Pristionchus mayeri]
MSYNSPTGKQMTGEMIRLEQSDLRIPQSVGVIRHTAHQTENGTVFHIEVMVNGNVNLTATMNGRSLEGSHDVHNVIGFHGTRGNAIFLQDARNFVCKVMIVEKKRIVTRFSHIHPADVCSANFPPLPLMPIKVFNIMSGPYRAFRVGSQLRILGLEFNPKTNPGLIINNFGEGMDAKAHIHSVVHRDFIVLFFVGINYLCRRRGEKVVEVEFPQFNKLNVNVPVRSKGKGRWI